MYSANQKVRRHASFSLIQNVPIAKKNLVLQDFYNKYKNDRSFEMICIARSQQQEAIETYWKEHSLTLPFSPQGDRAVYSMFADSGIPLIVITNQKGNITYIYTDKNTPTLSQLEESIK